MSEILEHAKRELKLAGYDIDREIPTPFESENDYADTCAKNAYEMLEVFAAGGHSGFSAQATLQIFNILAKWKTLTKLTNDPEEWEDMSSFSSQPAGSIFQSKRKPSCFSEDGLLTYYDIEEECNFDIVKDGEASYKKLKDKSEMVKHKLPNKGEEYEE